MRKTKLFNGLIMAVILLMAASLSAYSGGSGTEGAPYQIATTDDLIELSNTSGDWSAHFIQTANITFNEDETQVDWDGDETLEHGASGDDSYGFSPIGNNTTYFTGSYDGDDHTISNLYVNRPSTNFIGLFGWITGATIQNLGMVDVNINGSFASGGLVGYNYTNSTVSNSYSTGTVTGSWKYVGGLVGYNDNNSTVSNSYSTGSVTGERAAGGLVGANYDNSTVSNSYSTGDVTRASGSTDTYHGGFCGENDHSTIEYCFSTGSVFESDGVDWSSGDKGFVGYDDGGSTYTNNFFDTGSNQSSATGATGKTTTEMQDQSNFTNWDFTDTWAMSSSITFGGYPTLQWTDAYAETPSGSPYQITSLPNLVWIAEDDTRWSNDYEQTAVIDAWTTPSWDDGKGWTPIGNTGTKFTGSYDGGGYTIDNLFINRPLTDYISLFGYTHGATISNLGVTNVDVTGGNMYFGGLVGYISNNSTVSNSYSAGSVNGPGHSAGGLVGGG